ncbi:flavin reductase family protein [Arenibacter sp. GZD96]|uniref:flavin reductase family protein n=1 Tax=Aurantibrevibacter litoralis TaxID=3106030 RepID=UPI002AFF2427|nr:flavin reductase family protein [Arenibacter sp. GZD-96]MEA1787193.1 flavin reductase family protein [Arenibacter sp. GZD-96]
MYLCTPMSKIVSINPKEVSTVALQGYLLGAVGPRPIALASTLNREGVPNLAPFSFFNVFSSNPPILIFSPARRVRDNSTKHTLQNVLDTKEVVINVVNYDMVQQTSLASTDYAEGENEFVKAGFTMLASAIVNPFRVAESPVQFECKVTKIEPLGTNGGAGNLIFSEVLRIHIHADVLGAQGSIDPYKIDLVARMGANWYSRAKTGLFEVPKPLSTAGIGFDGIPTRIRLSRVLTGNDLGMLANVAQVPTADEIHQFVTENTEIQSIISTYNETQLHLKAQDYLQKKDVLSAWKVLLSN